MARFPLDPNVLKARLLGRLSLAGTRPPWQGQQAGQPETSAPAPGVTAPPGPDGGEQGTAAPDIEGLLRIPEVETFIAQSYRVLLGREPDPASASRYARRLRYVPFYSRRRFLNHLIGSDEYRGRARRDGPCPGCARLRAEMEQHRRDFEKDCRTYVEQCRGLQSHERQFEQERRTFDHERYVLGQQQKGLEWQRRQLEQERVACDQLRRRLEAERLELERQRHELGLRLSGPEFRQVGDQDLLEKFKQGGDVGPLPTPEAAAPPAESILPYLLRKQDPGAQTDREAS